MAYDYSNKVAVIPGKLYRGEMPHSEVCMSMRVAGKVMGFRLLPGRRAVQLYREDGSVFSAPILTGEAGLYEDNDGSYYYYPPLE